MDISQGADKKDSNVPHTKTFSNCSKSKENDGATGSKKTNSRNVDRMVVKTEIVPILGANDSRNPARVAVPRANPSLSKPSLDAPPLVLLTNLVPSIPIELFEIVAEAIEAATERPTLLLYEPKVDRPVNSIVDIAILPAYKNWENGMLLPISFAFQDRFNINKGAAMFADIAISNDVASRVKEDILDLRGYKCALPDRKKPIGSASLLFNFLRFHGEGPAFFGNILDTSSQIDALRMVAGKQVDVAVLESPVIMCNKNLPGVESLHTLASLGPLPPYRIMVNKNMPEEITGKITIYLKEIYQQPDWIEKFAPFGVQGFAENVESNYNVERVNSVATTIPYY